MKKAAGVLLGLVLIMGDRAATASDEPPAGLTRDDWSQIRGSLQQSEYQASRVAKSGEAPALQAPNRQQAYRTTFRRDGIEIVPQVRAADSWRLGLSLTGYGYQGDVRPLPVAEPTAEKGRVEYRRGPVTEWYENRPGGLEQGFTIAEPETRSREPLALVMEVEGSLRVRIQDEDTALFEDGAGGARVRYAGLAAWDAEGRALVSWLEASEGKLRVLVAAGEARFPVTVDPTFVQESRLEGQGEPNGVAGAQAGTSVSVSGETAVVGAPMDDTPGGLDAGSAYVFVRSGTTWAEQQKVVASDGAMGHKFGSSVSVSGDTLVVGSSFGGTGGSAYVFVRSGVAWTQQQKLLASDGAAGDQFGTSVSVSGDTAVVGAYRDDTASGVDAGSAYVFVRSGPLWSQHQKLVASDGALNDWFGTSVSVSGDTTVVGASQGDTAGGADAGSAYVFVRAGTVWSQQQKLVASDTAGGDGFGGSVSASGDTLVVGARGDDTASGVNAGSAYAFVRSGTVWSEQQKLVASDGAAADNFGASVSVSGDTAVVGAFVDDTPGAVDSGSAYVFVRSGTVWSEQQKLVASDATGSDWFGWSVSVSGNTAVAGALFDDTAGGADAGSAYAFVRSGTVWGQQQKLLASDGAADELFGRSVSVSGDTVVVGAFQDNTAGGTRAGSAYVFVRSGMVWTRQQKLVASDASASDYFGSSVSVSGDTTVVGAFLGDTAGGATGSAYVFVRSGTVWSQQQKLAASDGAAGDRFGNSVSVSGDTAVVGAEGDTTVVSGAGSAYVFVRSGAVWSQQQKLVASDGAALDSFGSSVSVSGDTAVIGAVGDDTAGGADAGSAYVFLRSGTIWTQQQKLLASDGATADRFGFSVSVSGTTTIVGAFGDTNGPMGGFGSAYVFVRSGTVWSPQQKLVASDAAAADFFGWSVSVSGDTAVIGAPGDDTAGGGGEGSAYVFVRSGIAWSQQQKLVASDGASSDSFGNSVSVSGDTAVIGAQVDDTLGGTDAGSAYAFRYQASADVALSIDSPDPVPLGANLVYTIIVTNNGADDSLGVQVANPTPFGLTFVSNAGACATPFPCALGTIPTGQSRTITATYNVPLGYGGPDPIVATVTSTATTFDPIPPNNQATATTAIAPAIADLAIVKVGPSTVVAGSVIVYTIIVFNGGPSDAPGVQVADPTPPGLTFVSNTGACTTPFPCVLGTVPRGENRVITATFNVPGAYSGPNPIVNQATVTSTIADANGANNTDDVTTTVLFSADLAIAMLGPATVTEGSDVVYSITIDNGGPSDAAGVQVADPTPAGLTFVSNTGSCTTPFPCALGSVPSGQNRVITATFHVPAGYSGPNPIVNQATVGATTGDPNGANNADDVSTTVLFVANLEPASIAVDAAGNSVFQPNETVTVAPGWRNGGTSAVADVTGAASSFTGPPGPTYTIADAAAAYGTIAAGTTASCAADCYGMTNAAATRPALHWDTTFLEAVTPGTSTKTWTLHIGDSFADVPATSGFYRFIETILHKNVTGGCTATAYCPSASTTRDQMAVFVLVSREPAGYTPPACGATPMFADVPVTNGFCRWIEELARRGVVGGCGGGNYCPSSPATREQMAVFVLRTLDPTLDPPACVAGSEMFADVPATSGFCRWIEELARRGVVTGCGDGNYCPTASVTREQMSVFLSVTFSLALYGL